SSRTAAGPGKLTLIRARSSRSRPGGVPYHLPRAPRPRIDVDMAVAVVFQAADRSLTSQERHDGACIAFNTKVGRIAREMPRVACTADAGIVAAAAACRIDGHSAKVRGHLMDDFAQLVVQARRCGAPTDRSSRQAGTKPALARHRLE